MNLCDHILARLAEDGVAIADDDPEIRHHIEGCPACTRVLADLRQLDAALRDLPGHDASDDLVRRTLYAVSEAGRAPDTPARSARRRRLVAGGLAASVVLAVSVGLTFNLWRPDRTLSVDELGIFSSSGEPRLYSLPPPADRPKIIGQLAQDRLDAPSPPASVEESSRLLRGLMSETGSGDRIQTPRSGKTGRKEQERFGQPQPAPPGGAADIQALQQRRLHNELEILARLGNRRAEETLIRWELDATASDGERVAGQSLESSEGETLGSLARAFGDRLDVDAGDGRETTPSKASRKRRGKRQNKDGKQATAPASSMDDESALAGPSGRDLSEDRDIPDGVTTEDPPSARDRAMEFLKRYRTTDDLAFQGASGYWSNSFIPGDPAMRHLQARLRDWKRTPLVTATRLEQGVHPLQQPFDAPRDAALTVYLDADTPAVTGPTRLQVQVGLKAAERQGGRRSAMNVGLVVDLRSAPTPEMAARIRALIFALSHQRQPEDWFSLIVAGPNGGLRVPAKRFRHGPLLVAMDAMFDSPSAPSSQATELPQALARARGEVLQGHDADGVLGSSLLLLVTGSSTATELQALEHMAHDSALDGIPLSVVAIGGSSDLQQVDRLVAAGQGNRRVLATAQEANALVDRELHASSRAVARALRLRIRLAQGVSLIGVLGSAPLAATDVARVRRAEKAIDRRVARSLGIQADRGEDEQGIQIIIPTFHAGDSHVILLDVLVRKPGPVADVTVRYKDVINLRNGVAQASLALDDDPGIATPLQDNVLKNLVAFEFAREMRSVSRQLVRGELRGAFTRLSALRDLLRGLRLEVPGWLNDSDIGDDVHLIETYLAVLGTPAGSDATQRLYIADSLRYAAFRKLQPVAK